MEAVAASAGQGAAAAGVLLRWAVLGLAAGLVADSAVLGLSAAVVASARVASAG